VIRVHFLRPALASAALIFILGAVLPAPTFAADASVVVELKEVGIGFPAEATVEAVKQATISAQIAGRVLDVRVEAGQRVKQGELMLRLDAREAAGGDAAAQANLAQARAAYERTRNLHAQKFVSQAALDQAEAAWKAAQGSAGASGATYSHANVTAPISGVVAERHVQLGEMAAPGVPLVTVFDPKGLRVIASIPQYKLAEIKRAGKASIEFPEIGRSVEASRIEVLPSVDAKSHTATARLYLPDGIEGIVPGMAARARFAVGQAKKLTVPPAAVLRRGEITAVYVLGAADGKAPPRLRQVRLGEPVASGDLEILAGLDAGERISLEPIKAGIAARGGK
jgi:RND family efflux transporter MFP subunit